MKYSFIDNLGGLGKQERVALGALLRETKGTITVRQAADVWQKTRAQAAKRLAMYNEKGWLLRIRQGVYIPVPLESKSNHVVPEEPFVVATNLFSPCYIGGANAANFWDLTEQLFTSITVMTKKMIPNRSPEIGETQYLIHTIKSRYFFGLKTVWLNGVKVSISDPSRTIVDMLVFPQFCGGIRFVAEVLGNYLHSEEANIELLIEYLDKLKNGAALKRLGYLLESKYPEQKRLIGYCEQNLTAGYTKLNPNQTCKKLVTHWRLWVPEAWRMENR